MRIILHELRKIFEWKKIVTTFVFCLVFYFMFIEFEFAHFPNGRPALDIYNISVQMIEKYGLSMDEQEFEDFKKTYEKEVERFNEYIQSREDFQDTGITNYEEFRMIDLGIESKQRELRDELIHEVGMDLFWELQAREWMIETYENKDTMFNFQSDSQREVERRREIINREEQPILPGIVTTNFQNIMRDTAAMIVLSIIIMLSPMYIKERRNHMFLLQYSSKVGRRLFLKKLIASIIAAVIIISVQLAVVFMLYRGNQTEIFFQSDINSIFASMFTWYDMTFGQYIILMVVLVYLLGIIIAAIVTFLSRISPNYLTVIGVQIPIVAILFGVLFRYMVRGPIHIDFPQFLAPALYAGILTISAGLIFFQWKREKIIDIDF